MPERVVLIPFPIANSEEHLATTKGGNSAPNAEAHLQEAQNALGLAQDLAARLSTMQVTTAEQEQRRVGVLQRNAQHVQTLTANLARAQEQRDLAIRPSWRKITATDVVCSDSPELGDALRRLQSAEDMLYIRGHCSRGSAILESSDHAVTITYRDVVRLLEGRLAKFFPGRIKVFGCETATSSPGADSFAQRLADRLAEKGWVYVQVLGYTHTLNSWILSPEGHKTAADGRRASSVRAAVQVRAPKGCCVVS
jgi:flagellar motor protein MotB